MTEEDWKVLRPVIVNELEDESIFTINWCKYQINGNKIIGRIGGQGTESECGELYQILSLGVNFQITLRMIHVRFRAESKVSRISIDLP